MDAARCEPPVAAPSGAAAQTARTPKILGRIDVAGTPLVITEREISFGNQQMKCDDVVGIRYGVYKHYINGIRTSQSYAVWLTDGRSTMFIECAKGFFVSSSTIETRYQEALKALYTAVMIPLIQSFLANLDKGTGFRISEVTFDKNGIHRSNSFGAVYKGLVGAWVSLTGGRSVEEREQQYQHLAWSEFGGHSFGKGQIHLFKQKKSWVQFALRDTWNAVCLGPLFDFLSEDGRLWEFVRQKPETSRAERILVVDDEEAVRETICGMLIPAGYQCRAVAGGQEALALLESGEKFELLLSDLLNAPLDGFALLERTKEKFPDIPVIIVTAINDVSVAAACTRSGAYEYLLHPVKREQLLVAVRRALEQHRQKLQDRCEARVKM